MRSVLVTGGNGFIGQWVVEELLARGYRVSVLDTRYREPGNGAQVVLGDVRDSTSIFEAVAHVGGVIHLAGVLGTQETVKNPRPAAETNILGGLNVLEACAQYNTPLVNIAVGNWWMNNTYSITKNAIERFCDMHAKYRGTRVSVVRALNAYGPRQSVSEPYGPSKVRKIMPSFICRALDDQPIEVYGDGSQIMDMIYVADVAKILVNALEWTDEAGAAEIAFEAGTGVPTTVNHIARTVAEIVGAMKGAAPVDVVHLPMRAGEPERSVVKGDPDTLKPLGITRDDLTDLDMGVEVTANHYREYLLNEAQRTLRL